MRERERASSAALLSVLGFVVEQLYCRARRKPRLLFIVQLVPVIILYNSRNQLNPFVLSGYLVYHSTVLRSAHKVYLYVYVWISEQTAIISLYNIN